MFCELRELILEVLEEELCPFFCFFYVFLSFQRRLLLLHNNKTWTWKQVYLTWKFFFALRAPISFFCFFFFFSSKLRFKHIVTAWLWVFYGSYSGLSEPTAPPTSRRTYLWKHWRSQAQLDRPQQLLIKLLRVLISSNSTLYLLMSSLQPSPTLLK